MIRFRGPNGSPGIESSTDRSGSTSTPITPPLRHPFAVQNMGLKDGKVHFAIHEGNIFTGLGFSQALINIDTATVTPVTSSLNPLQLTNANASTYYTFPLASGQKVLYVRAKRLALVDDWEFKLVANDTTTAQAEVTANPPTMVSTGETSLGLATHGGFPASLVAAAGMCGMTYTLTLEQEGKKFRANSQWTGIFTYPVAIFTKLADYVTCTQVLRSDIFFNYTRTTSVEYIDTAVKQITMEASGTCPCGCGCGGCGGGCCTCGGGGGCGCVPPGCG